MPAIRLLKSIFRLIRPTSRDIDYNQYMRSAAWHKRRRAALKRANYRCQYCGVIGVTLQVHHLTYERLGRERQSDLRVACIECHKKADEDRKLKAGCETYMEKVYGPKWRKRFTAQQAMGMFTEWIKEK